MGSPFGPAFANILVDYNGEKLFSQTLNTRTYFRYLTSQYSSSGVIKSLNDLYLDLKSTQNSQKLNVSKN